ncbi:hypothetical protein V5O48_006043 [Marasmius crinis-equi]|uniref:Uncharacterized protein n=1 Tax=Marasmius crinis-equi TaxID=585013 RepID=A0ABR3FKN4_9AGAR
MSYYNPLHTIVPSNQRSNYSSLGGAVSHNQAASSNRHRVPQTPYVPSGKWRAATGRVQPLNAPIVFDLNGFPGHGIFLQEMQTRGPQGIQQVMRGANDMVLAHTQLRRIALHIRWPGYEHFEWTRSIDVITLHGPITRAQLAAILASNFARYIEKIQYEATREIDWRLGSGGGFRYEDIILLSLVNVFEDAWQAEVAVEFR